MNRPDKAGEPSMEEILASIRQIIADEPAGDQPEPAIEANPLVPQSSAPRPAERQPLPLADRLSGVLKNGSLPPTSPLGSKRPFSFDQDLADIFDEKDSASDASSAAPKPDIRVPAALSHPMVSKSFVPPTSELSLPAAADSIPAAQPVMDGAAALPPHFAPSMPTLPPFPFGVDETPKEAAPSPAAPAPTATPIPAPAPASSFGFPPLRKSSFYPPEFSSMPPPSRPLGEPVQAAPAAMPAPAVESETSFDVDSIDDALRQIEERNAAAAASAVRMSTGVSEPAVAMTEIRDAEPASPAANDLPQMPSFGSFGASVPEPSLSEPVRDSAGFAGSEPFSSPAPEAGPQTYASFGAPQPEPQPAAPHGNAFASFTEIAPEPVPSPAPSFGAPPREPHPHASEFGGTPYSRSPGLSTDAAHQALDALALGLAASAAGYVREPQAQAVPLTPVELARGVDAEPQSHAQLPATVAPQGAAPRTLEDAVADMLRPMLQQWVADNMPRIIERALRTEVAQTVKPANKTPGT